jgi:uroporphyrinogen-III decarboxylase
LTAKERLQALLSGDRPGRPPFFPALYDYKAALANVPPHLYASSEEEIVRALTLEATDLSAEILTAAYDIYNVEAEALGAKVSRKPSIAMPEIEAPILSGLDKAGSLPDLTTPAGRMPLFIEAAGKALAQFGNDIPVRGGISGPFSMASKLYNREQLLMDTVMDPEGVKKLLAYCTKIIKLYATGFIFKGAGVAVFDSFIAPPMLSPQIYEELVLPFHKELFDCLKARGVAHRPLIAGGNILPLLPRLVETGANQLLLDYNIPLPQVRGAMEAYPGMLFRVNLSPVLVSDGKKDVIVRETQKVLEALKGLPNLILGTGILPLHTPGENIGVVRETLVKHFSP